MHYLGIYLNEGDAPSTFVIIHKKFKNLRKYYELIDVNRFSSPTDFSEIISKVSSIYNDRNYLKIKRVFSQDGRPSKKVPANPKIITGFKDKDINPFDDIRKNEIPVECLLIEQGGRDKKEEKEAITLGKNYAVDYHHMERTLSDVLIQKRLAINCTSPYAKDIKEVIQNFDTRTTSNPLFSCDLNYFLHAVSIPVWFTENVRQIKRY